MSRRAGRAPAIVGALLLVFHLFAANAQPVAAVDSQQQPQQPQQAPPLQEIAVAATAFVRGAALPAWADLLPLPPEQPTGRALAVRLAEEQLRIGDGPAVELHSTARQANDPAALAQLGQVSIAFIPAYQRLLLHKVAVVRGTGQVDHTATVPVRFLQRETRLEQGIYSGVITATMLLPDVRVGDTLLLQYSIEGTNPIFGARYANVLGWEQQQPVQQRRVTVTYPESRRMRWAWTGLESTPPAGPVVSTTNGVRRLRFEQRDLPGVEIEPLMPRGYAPLHWLQFSEYQDWSDVAGWAAPLFSADEPVPSELVPVLTRLLRLPSRNDQASQALQWVQSEIRYVSVSLGESSHRPHTPADVLRNRYGDCKDKSFLLVRMLQSLGMQARPVLASLAAPWRPARMIASPLAFDHVVVQLTLDGRDYFLDPTRLGQRGPLDRMGQGLEDASVLVVDAGAESRALTTVRSPNRRELFQGELVEKFRVPAFDADAELETTQTWNGLDAELMRLTITRLDAARLQAAALSGIDKRYPGLTVVGTPEVTDAVDLNRITIRARYTLPKPVTAANGGWALRYTAANLQGALNTPGGNPATRLQPLAVPSFPRTILYSAEVQWPEGVSGVMDPTTQRIADPAFTIDVTKSFRGPVARTALVFQALAPELAAPAVPQFVRHVQELNRAVGGAMAVDKTQVKSGGLLGVGRQTLQATLAARAQTIVDRTTQAIATGALAGEDLAEALCGRAEALSEIGRLPEGLKDARAATQAAPALGRAWFCSGNLDWASGDFAQAGVEFGKSLTLGMSPYESYLRRGQARYYEGRLEQAADDFAKAAANRTEPVTKPYAMLWWAATLQRLGRPLPADFQALAAADPVRAWPQSGLGLYTGQATPEQVIAALDGRTGDDRQLALAEAWFYVGQYELARGEAARAKAAFEKARAQGVTIYIEHVAAGIELQRIAAKP
jgi:lipoprotein NlpI/transglutaminase-like putative cysteine protease